MKQGQKNDGFKLILILVSVFFICLFYFVSFSRIAYPFELEWMEGGSVDHLERIMNGQPIYTPPSVEFIPYIYTPLYYISAIPLTKAFGISLLPLRLVSLISTTLIMLVLFNFIKKESGKSFYGLVAAGLFAASFSIGGAWYDLARVDMLFILMFLLAFYFLRFYKSKTGYFVAAIFASLSFLTKQTATLTILPICLYLFIHDRKRSWYFNLTFWIIVFATTIYFTLISDGW